MELLTSGIGSALARLAAGDAELWSIATRTLGISGLATLLAIAGGIPAGLALAEARLPVRRLWLAVVYTGMGLPTVLVGLVLTLLFWSDGLLGSLRLLFTPAAMVAGQALIALPVVTGLTASAVQSVDARVRTQLLALGASPSQAAVLLAWQARRGVIAACAAGLGAAVSEVGAAMMLGGNLSGSTRVLTTATVTEARMGRFDTAIGLGVLLLLIAFAANAVIVFFQPRVR